MPTPDEIKSAIEIFEKSLKESIKGHTAHGRKLEPEEREYFDSAKSVLECAKLRLLAEEGMPEEKIDTAPPYANIYSEKYIQEKIKRESYNDCRSKCLAVRMKDMERIKSIYYKLEEARILSVKEPMQLSDRINLNGIIREAQSELQKLKEGKR